MSKYLILDSAIITKSIDCACVIHGDRYGWEYVENLYNMLQANSKHVIKLHVFTEKSRSVPSYMIKHSLSEWPGIAGPKRSWWYKMQLFNPDNFAGQLLYFDLDVVIVDSIDWIFGLDNSYFWAVRDFKYLWREGWKKINSSVMYWDTRQFSHIWQEFQQQNIDSLVRKFHGDQDYIDTFLTDQNRCFFDTEYVTSWRWQAVDGGFDTITRTHKDPGTGTKLTPNTKILIFHGDPKPDKIDDPIVQIHWTRKRS